jgi:hypothetical protein
MNNPHSRQDCLCSWESLWRSGDPAPHLSLLPKGLQVDYTTSDLSFHKVNGANKATERKTDRMLAAT